MPLMLVHSSCICERGRQFVPGVITALSELTNRYGYSCFVYGDALENWAEMALERERVVLKKFGESALPAEPERQPIEVLPSVCIAYHHPNDELDIPKDCLFVEFGTEGAIDWHEILTSVLLPIREASVERVTHETEVYVRLVLDGRGESEVNTGIGFFDHMLDQVARHSLCDLQIRCKGDLHVDEHHSIEDTGLALGQAFREALGNKCGVERYGFVLPMDESVATVALDFSGRSCLEWRVELKRERIGELPTEMVKHFFKSFCDTAGVTLYIHAEGENEHHKVEGVFKAFAKSIRQAVSRDRYVLRIPSTKGIL